MHTNMSTIEHTRTYIHGILHTKTGIPNKNKNLDTHIHTHTHAYTHTHTHIHSNSPTYPGHMQHEVINLRTDILNTKAHTYTHTNMQK